MQGHLPVLEACGYVHAEREAASLVLVVGRVQEEGAFPGARRKIADERHKRERTGISRKRVDRSDFHDVLNGDFAAIVGLDRAADEERMNNRRRSSGGLVRGCRFSHGRAPYPTRPSLPTLAFTVLAALLALWGPQAVAAPATAQLKASGAAKRFNIPVAGKAVTMRFTQVAGCRYRLTATPGTLKRPIFELGRLDEEPITRVDAGASGQAAVHVWDAERNAAMAIRLQGFSAQVGLATIRLETLGPGDRKVKAHRRFLAPGGERARVGELLVGEPNRWELAVEAGTAYVITPTRGSAGRVRLTVLGWDGVALADSILGAAAWLALPPVRFKAPPKPEDTKRRSLVLVVASLLDGGGTYGVKLRALPADQAVEPAEVTPPETVERGVVEGAVNTFRAGPGDVAVLYVPHSPGRSQVVEMKRGERWVHLEDMGLGSSARSQENSLLVWFQPYYPGTYRFRDTFGRPSPGAQLLLHDRAALGSAPVHMGTGADPTPSARLRSDWSLVGLAVCMPGWDYLFVCVHAPDMGVAMRVRDGDGKTVKTRSASARTISPGLGPSLRFKVRKAGVYRLEARNARKRVIRPLLRRAAD